MKTFLSIALGALIAFFIFISVVLFEEGDRMEQWCTEQGGSLPNGTLSDPICVRDGLILIPPVDSNARWPG